MKLLLAAAFALCAINASAASTVVSADDPRLQPAEVVRVEPSGPTGFPEIYVDGYIHKATVEAFKRLGNLNGSGMGMVYFNSLGGDLVAAVELGQLIRERGFSTRVGRKGTSGKPLPGRCESGCPLPSQVAASDSLKRAQASVCTSSTEQPACRRMTCPTRKLLRL